MCPRRTPGRAGVTAHLLAAGLAREQILEELPDLEPDDIRAARRVIVMMSHTGPDGFTLVDVAPGHTEEEVRQATGAAVR